MADGAVLATGMEVARSENVVKDVAMGERDGVGDGPKAAQIHGYFPALSLQRINCYKALRNLT